MEKGLNKYLYYPLRAISMATFILIIREFTNRRIYALAGDPNMSSQIPRTVFCLFSILCTILITNSVINYFTVYDKREMFAYLELGRREVSFRREIAYVLRRESFYLEVLPHILITVALVFLDFYGEYAYIFSVSGILKRGFLGYFVIALICALVVFVLSLLTRYEAIRYWFNLKRKKDIKRLSSKTIMIIRAVCVIAIYPLAAPYLPYLAFIIFTLFRLAVTLASILTMFGLILSIIALILVIKLTLTVKARLNARGLIRKITETARPLGYDVRILQDKERDEWGCDIILERGDERFSIRLIESRSVRTPLYFTERDAYFLYKIGTKNHFQSIESHFDYTFDAEGIKILLLPKAPRHLFVKEGERSAALYVGDRIWDYIVYEPKSLLGNMDRDCLGRANNDY